MTEEVLISVKGLHTMEETGDDNIEMISPGKYYNRNGKHYIIYEELLEGTNETVQNCIKLQKGRMEVKKKGVIQAEMIFEQNRKNTSWYGTPYGNMMAGIEVNSMQMAETEEMIQVDVDYSLELNYEHLADCNITVKVMAKDRGLLRLS
jgi:uncharacterized beta-barrel protein YwiB (DUF1934 family)